MIKQSKDCGNAWAAGVASLPFGYDLHSAELLLILTLSLFPHVQVPPWMKLPGLYLLDMISKNIYEAYARLFAAFIVPLFLEAYEQVDNPTRTKMEELVITWRTGGLD